MFHLVTLGYLDPGAGSMLLQALIGGSAGLIVFVRHLFRNWKVSRGTAQTPVKRV